MSLLRSRGYRGEGAHGEVREAAKREGGGPVKREIRGAQVLNERESVKEARERE